jgi:hypothetical protein
MWQKKDSSTGGRGLNCGVLTHRRGSRDWLARGQTAAASSGFRYGSTGDWCSTDAGAEENTETGRLPRRGLKSPSKEDTSPCCGLLIPLRQAHAFGGAEAPHLANPTPHGSLTRPSSPGWRHDRSAHNDSSSRNVSAVTAIQPPLPLYDIRPCSGYIDFSGPLA